MTIFGQIVIGSPGSGKTTYCKQLKSVLQKKKRRVKMINLDPANENVPKITDTGKIIENAEDEFDIDIGDLIRVEAVMDEMKLGPHGALLFVMEYLEVNFDWLEEQLALHTRDGDYLIIDCPGQIELFTHHTALCNIFDRFSNPKLYNKDNNHDQQSHNSGSNSSSTSNSQSTNQQKAASRHAVNDLRLCCVQLMDSFYCSNPSTYVSLVLTALSSMLNLQLPHINALSKADLLESIRPLHYNIEFYTQVQDLNYLLQYLQNVTSEKFQKLSKGLVEIIEQYPLVHFELLDAGNPQSVLRMISVCDKAIGYYESRGSPGDSSSSTGIDKSNCVAASHCPAVFADDFYDRYQDGDSSNTMETKIIRDEHGLTTSTEESENY